MTPFACGAVAGTSCIEQWAAMIGPRLVGLVFLVSGAAKVMRPNLFAAHVRELRLLPDRYAWRVSMLASMGEVGLGTALLLEAWFPASCAAAFVIVVAFTGIAQWAARTGRSENCGCYGNLVEVSPRTEVGLNLLYLLLLIPGLMAWGPARVPTPLWATATVVAASVISPLLGVLAYLHLARTGKPWLDRSPVRPGRMIDTSLFPPGWAPLFDGRVLVVFLSSGCGQCKTWVPILNAAHVRSDFPHVVAVLGDETEVVEEFVRENRVQFPVTTVSEKRFLEHITRTPMALLVRNEVVTDRWTWFLPRDFVAPLATARSVATQPAPAS